MPRLWATLPDRSFVMDFGYAPDLMKWRSVAAVTGKGGLWFMVALALVGAGNMGFHVVVSRLLGPAAYGAFGSLLALLTLMTVPASGMQTLVTARTARVVESGRPPDGRVQFRRALTLGAAAAVVLLFVSPLVQQLLRLDSIWPAIWLALYAVPLAAIVVPWGLLCGQGRFATVGTVAVVSTVVRISVAVLFIKTGFGVSGAVVASVIADSLQGLVLHLLSRRLRAKDPADGVTLRINARSSLGGVVAYAGLWLLTGVDTIAARQLLDDVSGGRYSAAATALHGALYGAHALSLAALPAFAASDVAGSLRALKRVLIATAAVTIPAMVLLTVVSPWLVPMVFGATFQVPVPVIALMAVATTGVALLWVLVQYSIAQSRRGAMAAWFGLPVAVIGAALWHPDMAALAAVTIVAVLIPLVLAARWVSPWYQARTVALSSTVLPVPAAAVDLTVVVPFYNPGAALRSTMQRLIAELRECGVTFEIVAVDDGSTDGSSATIADLDPTVVRSLALPHNQGKGSAVRYGLHHGNGRYLGFVDADGDLDPALWRSFTQLMRLYEPDGVIGDKLHPLTLTDSGASWTRNICSYGYRTLVRLLFPTLRVRDTQVGMKVFRRELLADVLPRCVERRFVLDVEILALANRMGYRRILTAPISLYRVDQTTVTPRAVLRMFADTVRLAWRMQIRDDYRLAGLRARLVRDPVPTVPRQFNPQQQPPAPPATLGQSAFAEVS